MLRPLLYVVLLSLALVPCPVSADTDSLGEYRGIKLADPSGKYGLELKSLKVIFEECERDTLNGCFNLATFVEPIDEAAAQKYFKVSCDAGNKLACDGLADLIARADPQANAFADPQLRAAIESSCNLQEPSTTTAGCDKYAGLLLHDGKKQEAFDLYLKLAKQSGEGYGKIGLAKLVKEAGYFDFYCALHFAACNKGIAEACPALEQCTTISNEVAKLQAKRSGERDEARRKEINALTLRAFDLQRQKKNEEAVALHKAAFAKGNLNSAIALNSLAPDDAELEDILVRACNGFEQSTCGYLASRYLEKRQFEKAADAATTAVLVDPLEGYPLLARVRKKEGKLSEALTIEQMLCAVESGIDKGSLAAACKREQRLRETTNDLAHKLADLKTGCSAEQRGDEDSTTSSLGSSCAELVKLYRDSGKPEEALSVAEALCHPGSTEYETSMHCTQYAELLQEVGRTEEAVTLLRTQCEGEVAGSCMQLVNIERARKNWDAAIALADKECRRTARFGCGQRDTLLRESGKDVGRYFSEQCAGGDSLYCFYSGLHQELAGSKDAADLFKKAYTMAETQCREQQEEYACLTQSLIACKEDAEKGATLLEEQCTRGFREACRVKEKDVCKRIESELREEFRRNFGLQ